MTRPEIRKAVEARLEALGFAKGSYLWQPASAELIFISNGHLKKLKLNAGMSKRELTFKLGWLSGLVEGLELVARADKIRGAHLNGNGAAMHA